MHSLLRHADEWARRRWCAVDRRRTSWEMRRAITEIGRRGSPRGSNQPAADGDGRRLVPVADAELGVEVLGVGLDGAHADEEGRGDLLVGAAGDEQAQHVALAV